MTEHLDLKRLQQLANQADSRRLACERPRRELLR